MKSIFCGGKFKLNPDKSLTLEQRIKDDYRVVLLKDVNKFIYANSDSIIADQFKYKGTFYCEKASNGEYTSTECNTVLNEEYKALSESDIFLCVFDDTFSVGTVVELNWAVNLNKEIIICFQKKEDSPYSVKSEYWFAIVDALNRTKNVKIFPFGTHEELLDLILNKKIFKD